MSQIEELKGLEKTLREQLNKLDKHNRQGSKETQKRYRETCTRFLRHMARNFHLRKLNNIP